MSSEQVLASHAPALRRQGKISWVIFHLVLRVADIVAVLIGATFAHYIWFSDTVLSRHELQLAVYYAISIAVALNFLSSYTRENIKDVYEMMTALVLSSVLALLLFLLIAFLTGDIQYASRSWVLGMVLYTGCTVVLSRIFARNAMIRLQFRDYLKESVILVGAGPRAGRIIRQVSETQSQEVDILGVFDDRLGRIPDMIEGLKIQGTTDDLIAFVRNTHVDRIIVTLPWSAEDRIILMLRKLRTVPVRLDLCPEDVIWNFSSANVERVGGIPTVTVANGRLGGDNRMFKRVEDLVVGLVALTLLSPIMLMVALLVRLDSKGPVLFKQPRFGFNNQRFTIYKFRTMKMGDSTNAAFVQAVKGDPRVTRIGKFLRRTSLDELPQLLNVIKGDMSVVGPRPHPIQLNMEFAGIIDEYFARHNVKPGITGWAQINGLRGETDTNEKMRKRVEFDLFYVENWSIFLDLKILFLTAVKVWFQDTAY